VLQDASHGMEEAVTTATSFFASSPPIRTLVSTKFLGPKVLELYVLDEKINEKYFKMIAKRMENKNKIASSGVPGCPWRLSAVFRESFGACWNIFDYPGGLLF